MNASKTKKYILAIPAIVTASALLLTPPLALCHESVGAVSSLCDTEKETSEVIFFGESTTAHLARTGGVLDTPQERRSVWRDESGTRMLDRRIMTGTVLYTNGNGQTERITLEEALRREQPSLIVLSFGLNGILSFSKNPDVFLSSYRHLITEIIRISPDTRMILQSIYPVRCADSFSVDADTLNQKIRQLNSLVRTLCDEYDCVRYADTASVLCDKNGALRECYDNGDGIHLTNGAYREILAFLRTML